MGHFHLHLLLTSAITSVVLAGATGTYLKPAVILVPGSFHQPLVFDPVAEALREAQFDHIYPIDLPSNGELLPNRDLDIQAVRTPLEKELASGRDVVLVGNSYGATVIGDSLKDFKKDASHGQRRHCHGRGKILGVVMLAGYIPYISEVEHPETKPDVRDVAPRLFRFDDEGKVWADGDPDLSSEEAFYNELPVDEQKFYASKLQFQSYNAMNATARYIPYTGDFRCLYVIGLKDKSIPPAWAQTFVDQKGAKFEVSELDTDHVMMLSRPREVTDIIRKVAGS